jgi:hypothetical protein
MPVGHVQASGSRGCTDQPLHRGRNRPGGRLGIGVAVGVLVALLTSYVPVVAILVIGAALVASWAVLARGLRDERSASLVGIVLGAGLALVYGAVTAITACAQTDTFCGNANVMPLLAFALIAVY